MIMLADAETKYYVAEILHHTEISSLYTQSAETLNDPKYQSFESESK